jgi:hypothetical protein
MPHIILKCPNGHKYEQMVFAEGSYKAGWTCMRCDVSHPPSDARHFCKACSLDLCYNCEPPEDDVEMMPTFLNPVTKRHEPLLVQDAAGMWVAPTFVEDMIALKFTYISDTHKKMIQVKGAWAVRLCEVDGCRGSGSEWKIASRQSQTTPPLISSAP